MRNKNINEDVASKIQRGIGDIVGKFANSDSNEPPEFFQFLKHLDRMNKSANEFLRLGVTITNRNFDKDKNVFFVELDFSINPDIKNAILGLGNEQQKKQAAVQQQPQSVQQQQGAQESKINEATLGDIVNNITNSIQKFSYNQKIQAALKEFLEAIKSLKSSGHKVNVFNVRDNIIRIEYDLGPNAEKILVSLKKRGVGVEKERENEKENISDPQKRVNMDGASLFAAINSGKLDFDDLADNELRRIFDHVKKTSGDNSNAQTREEMQGFIFSKMKNEKLEEEDDVEIIKNLVSEKLSVDFLSSSVSVKKLSSILKKLKGKPESWEPEDVKAALIEKIEELKTGTKKKQDSGDLKYRDPNDMEFDELMDYLAKVPTNIFIDMVMDMSNSLYTNFVKNGKGARAAWSENIPNGKSKIEYMAKSIDDGAMSVYDGTIKELKSFLTSKGISKQSLPSDPRELAALAQKHYLMSSDSTSDMLNDVWNLIVYRNNLNVHDLKDIKTKAFNKLRPQKISSFEDAEKKILNYLKTNSGIGVSIR